MRLIAGLAAPDGIRLEAMAPFGPPVFILASAGEDTTLLLPRDDRVLRGEPPAAILEAFAGIRVTPAALRRLLAGCPVEDVDARDVRAIGEDWVLARTGDRSTAYLHRVRGRWRLAAVRGAARSTWSSARAKPHSRRMCGSAAPTRAPIATFDLMLRLSQVEVDTDVPDEAFTVSCTGGCRVHFARRASPIGSIARSVRVVIPLVARAHAKMNLDLRIVGRREDGDHDLRTMFQSLALHDRLVFRRTARCRS